MSQPTANETIDAIGEVLERVLYDDDHVEHLRTMHGDADVLAYARVAASALRRIEEILGAYYEPILARMEAAAANRETDAGRRR